MESAQEISEFGTGLRAHLGLDHESEPLHDEPATVPADPEPPAEPDELDVLALLEAELIERERAVSAREAVLEARGVPAVVDELALARERRRGRVDA
jgi:hypothetical protein